MKKLIILICVILPFSLSAQSKIGIEFNHTIIVSKETREIITQWNHRPLHIIIDVKENAVFIEDIEQPERFHKLDILETGNPEKNVWGYMLYDRYIVIDMPNKELQIYLNKSEDVTVCNNIDITFF